MLFPYSQGLSHSPSYMGVNSGKRDWSPYGLVHRASREVVWVSSAGYDSVFGKSHEEAGVAVVASSKWALNGLSILVKFDLEFADYNGHWVDIGVQWC